MNRSPYIPSPAYLPWRRNRARSQSWKRLCSYLMATNYQKNSLSGLSPFNIISTSLRARSARQWLEAHDFCKTCATSAASCFDFLNAAWNNSRSDSALDDTGVTDAASSDASASERRAFEMSCRPAKAAISHARTADLW